MKSIVLLFPGQGSQYVGMGKELYTQHSIARKVFEEASDSLHIDMKKLCFESKASELMKTENAQPSILTTSYAAFSVYMQNEGIRPDYMAGHSLGEITALTCAGGIQFSDAVKIVKQRGRFMQEAVAIGSGCMTAVYGLDIDVIDRECKRFSTDGSLVSISNYNSENQVVVSGDVHAVSELENSLKQLGAVLTRLNVSAPFHCSLMQPAVDKLREELNQYEYRNLNYPVISNSFARPYSKYESIKENIVKQIVMPVRWLETMEYLYNNGITNAIEMGPGSILTNIIKKSGINMQSYSYEDAIKGKDKRPIQTMEMSILSKKSDVLTRCLAMAVCTKNSNWNNDEYLEGVIKPYNSIKQLQEMLTAKGESPSKDQALKAMEMLKSVLTTKKIPKEEQIKIMEEIITETETEELFTEFKYR
ncbi:ACP S-malonyltransferase [Anaerosporobacter faecicola]|uniref:ACP S-malonyltransferase n=1 Tax=Anaerosporobacter faecicola TaxID=2718714 RepID=UPI00143A7258|nr:ACP S-malonyltransferase [Anaerosporobacter faecicola]